MERRKRGGESMGEKGSGGRGESGGKESGGGRGEGGGMETIRNIEE